MQNFPVINPKIAFFLAVVPFMCICPISLTSLIWGFPSAIFQNNERRDNFEMIFNEIDFGNDIATVGQTQSLIGGFDTFSDNERGTCDLLAYKTVSAVLELEEIQAEILDAFREGVSTEFAADNYSIISGAQIKVFPLNPDQDYFAHDGFEIWIEPLDSLTEDEIPYLVYMINRDVYTSRDSRCSAQEVPESSVIVEKEIEETEDEIGQ